MRGWGCVQAGDLLAQHRGGLSDADRLRLEQHLEDCAECRFDAAALDDFATRVMSTPIDGVADAALRRALGETEHRPISGKRAEPIRRGAPWGLVGLASAAALLLALGFVLLRSGEPEPDRVQARSADHGSLVAAEATRIRVAHGLVHVPRGAELTWSGSDVVLRREWVSVDVDPRPHRPFRVVTRRFTVEVTGTAFDVSLRGVRVRRGSVRIVAPEGRILRARVGAGESWRLEPSPRAAPPSVGSPPESMAVNTPPPAPDRAAPRERLTRTERQLPAAELSPRVGFERAVRLQATDPVAAARAFEELESEGGAWAANALFARGQLALTRGRREEARRIFERYLRTSPEGLNAADARTLLDELE